MCVADLQSEMDRIGYGKIASVCGRYYVMDRDNNWDRVEKAYDMLTLGNGVQALNAVDAVKAKNIPDGRIDINFIEEDKWLCVDLTDNGIGMSRKETKKIWKPFVSSKKTFMNWGIGLSQVRNIIEAHLGYIDIMSKKNEYTKIQLVFQRN